MSYSGKNARQGFDREGLSSGFHLRKFNKDSGFRLRKAKLVAHWVSGGV